MEENGGVRLGADVGCVFGYAYIGVHVDANRTNLISGLLLGFGAPDDFRRGDQMSGRCGGLRGEQRE